MVGQRWIAAKGKLPENHPVRAALAGALIYVALALAYIVLSGRVAAACADSLDDLRAIEACKAQGKYVGICGQGPSDHPDFARWLADEGIASISLNPDSVIDTWTLLAQ